MQNLENLTNNSEEIKETNIPLRFGLKDFLALVTLSGIGMSLVKNNSNDAYNAAWTAYAGYVFCVPYIIDILTRNQYENNPIKKEY